MLVCCWNGILTRRTYRVDFTVLPLLFLGLFVFQLDRMNLGSALTAGFAVDIKINQATVNMGNQLMFAGIVLLEIPSNMLLQKVSYLAELQPLPLTSLCTLISNKSNGILIT